MTYAQHEVSILIVDDHRLTLDLLQTMVSAAFPACRVLTADSGERALELCATQAPHIIVMDISMGGIDGIEATRRIKLLLPDTQVVMHSGNDAEIYRKASAAAGTAAFVSKSRTSCDLIPAISALL